MKTHFLKIRECYARRLLDGSKTYELRRNDCDFQVGDLVSFSINSFEYGEWTLPVYKISHVLQDVKEYGLEHGFAILSLSKINSDCDEENIITWGKSIDDHLKRS